MFETTVIRVMAYLVGIYMILAAVHQLIVSHFLDFQSWVEQAVDSSTISTLIVSASIPIGIGVTVAAFFNKRMLLLVSLAFAASYQIALTILNIIDTKFQGTPAIPALTIAFLAELLWCYYKLQPKALEI